MKREDISIDALQVSASTRQPANALRRPAGAVSDSRHVGLGNDNLTEVAKIAQELAAGAETAITKVGGNA